MTDVDLTDDTTSGGRVRLSSGVARLLVILLTALTVGLAGAVAGLQIAKPGLDGLDGVRAEALKSGTERVPKMLSYSYTTIDADIRTATAQTTGDFKQEFTTLMDSQVRKGALSGKITTTAKAVQEGVVSASSTSVTLLVFLDLTTSSGPKGTPQLNGSRVEVTMTKVGNDWLVSELKPV